MESLLVAIFWISFGLGVYVYLAYPVILTILASMARPRKAAFHDDSELPRVALLIACYNEEKEIGARLLNTLLLDYPRGRLSVFVLNDGSKDRTIEEARKVADARPEGYFQILDFTENRGKCATLLRGVNWIKENRPDVEVLAFSDANSEWQPDSLKKLVAPYADPTVGASSGRFVYVDPSGSPIGNMEGLYWKYEKYLKRLSSRLGSLPMADGAIFSIRLDAYEPLSETRGDDFELPVQAIIKGYRSVAVEDAISKEPPSPSFLVEYRRKLRIIGHMIPSSVVLFARALRKGRMLLAFQLLSHKLLRYLVPFYQIALLLSNGFLWNYSQFFRVTFVVQILFYLLAGAGFLLERNGRRPPKPLQIPFYFTMVNFASMVSIFRLAVGAPIRWERNR
jgi:cellulose synthase/poly-beta-1,6-N-acetylglucosamine synthase-like glycosyltransferase